MMAEYIIERSKIAEMLNAVNGLAKKFLRR